jgi:endonuclease-3 related protein
MTPPVDTGTVIPGHAAVTHGRTVAEALRSIYRRLLDRYGPQHWWPARDPFEVTVGAILTQSTAWTNVEKAIAGLRAAGRLSAAALLALPEPELAELIRPCGYYNVKARRLKAFVGWLVKTCGGDLEKLFSRDAVTLRRELLGIYGIGEETADSILLYAGNLPVFVIDAYTRRILGRLGLSPAQACPPESGSTRGRDSYAAFQALFMENLPPDPRLFNEYHALLVHLGKDCCRKTPRCSGCPLNPCRGK